MVVSKALRMSLSVLAFFLSIVNNRLTAIAIATFDV